MRRLLPIAALLACLVAPAAAPAATNLELAVQDDPVLLNRSWGDDQLALDRAVEMGATWVRVNLRWAASMPDSQAKARHKPHIVAWDFSRLSRLLDQTDGRGLNVQVTLTGPAPAWATSDHRVGNRTPSKQQFGRFVGAAVRAFSGRVTRWSVWNEPNWNTQLGPRSRAASIYRGLYRSAYAAITAEQPGAQVLIGEMMPGANRTHSIPLLRFLRTVACKRCPSLRADGFALHPYNFARRPSKARSSNRDIVEMGSLSRLTRALDDLSARGRLRPRRGGRMPLYLTEFGYHTTGPVAVSSSTHARWMTEAYTIAERNPRVRQLLQYQLIDPWPASVSWRSAVLKRDGTPTAAFRALAKLASSG
jgi:hypothetical protein